MHGKNAHTTSGKSVSTGAPLSSTAPHRLLHQVLSLKLCPKATTQNIPEHVVLREVLQRGLDKGWPITVWLQTWIVLQGIRGHEGILEAERVMDRYIPKWSKERYVNGFAEKWLGRWAKAVIRTQRIGVFSHQEGLLSGMSGHHFVTTLRCPRQRCNISDLAWKLQNFAPDTFAVADVLAVKELLHKSGIMLRLATPTTEGAGLATQTSYNAMHRIVHVDA